MDWTGIALFYVTLIISLTAHEAAHALFAMLGGDRTAYYAGQVTLNPIPHMQREPFGTIVLPLLVLLMSNGSMCFGFAHAPIDPIWAYHNPRKAALMSARVALESSRVWDAPLLPRSRQMATMNGLTMGFLLRVAAFGPLGVGHGDDLPTWPADVGLRELDGVIAAVGQSVSRVERVGDP